MILKLDDSLNAASKALKQRNKLIRIADKSEAGWTAVDEYLSDEVASGSEDEKKIRAAEQRALRKKKNVHIAKSGQKLSIFICYFYSCPLSVLYFLQRLGDRILALPTYSSYTINSLLCICLYASLLQSLEHK